ncbi:MAG: aminodeoxychorismate synthase component I [Gammaproteobacteria bacterium]|nr:aminodeoxychorismate synthase component I [Gammaproteobacteria bacterium]MCF6363592.1 aminodeoxychorismate synthase component I [Gammaproteobacteria bacterium]
MPYTCFLDIVAAPDLLDLHEAHPTRYPFLLESVAQGGTARYDILFALPAETLSSASGGDFLTLLDATWRQASSADASDMEIPFHGGWFLYLGYELAAQVEPRLRLPAANDGLPVAFATRVPAAVIRDHRRDGLVLVAEQPEQLVQLKADLASLPARSAGEAAAPLPLSLHETPPEPYLSGVQRCKDYIVEGDVFQVNLSRLWHGALGADIRPADIYRRLRRHNPAPFAGLALHGDSAIISSSPERLVRVRGDCVDTRPIAGTRPRNIGAQEDRALQDELLTHPKERAEHIMLIDLERNDLGRICIPGTVKVDELMVLESYAHVHHIVSNVCGRLRPGTTPGEVIRAVFPGGTITGCPKVRCMEILSELEGEGRGAYTGSMGYLNHDGSLDLNILIRTIVQHGQALSLRAGGGIVADSVPECELEETRAKARGLLLALGDEQSGAA